jgi:C1A family cysteine protease
MALIQNILRRLFKKQPRQNEPKTSDIFVLNIKKDSDDERDYKQVSISPVQLPPFIDHSLNCPPIKNQGSIGSCGSHAMCTGIETLYNLDKSDWNMPLSELWHYYQVRVMEGTFPQDAGQTGRGAMKVANQYGVSPEKLDPYVTANFNNKPSIFADAFARWFKIKSYYRCTSEIQIKSALAAGKSIWIGVPVANSIFSYSNGVINYPSDSIIGGHALCVVGYDDTLRAYKFVNSWGTWWGQGGFGLLSYDYITQAPWYDAWAFDIK